VRAQVVAQIEQERCARRVERVQPREVELDEPVDPFRDELAHALDRRRSGVQQEPAAELE
jgi:hypothetical protein